MSRNKLAPSEVFFVSKRKVVPRSFLRLFVLLSDVFASGEKTGSFLFVAKTPVSLNFVKTKILFKQESKAANLMVAV